MYVCMYVYICTYYINIYDGSTNRLNLEMEPNYLRKSDVQLNPNILGTKNNKTVL